MTSWKTLVGNSEFLNADDLAGRMVTAKISATEGGTFEGDDEKEGTKTTRKVFISFEGKQKKFAAGPLNCQLIEAMWGEDIEDWVGHWLTLRVDPCEVKGSYYEQPCIRIAGSPELKASVEVLIRLKSKNGRERKPIPRTLIPTKTGAQETFPGGEG